MTRQKYCARFSSSGSVLQVVENNESNSALRSEKCLLSVDWHRASIRPARDELPQCLRHDILTTCYRAETEETVSRHRVQIKVFWLNSVTVFGQNGTLTFSWRRECEELFSVPCCGFVKFRGQAWPAAGGEYGCSGTYGEGRWRKA